MAEQDCEVNLQSSVLAKQIFTAKKEHRFDVWLHLFAKLSQAEGSQGGNCVQKKAQPTDSKAAGNITRNEGKER